MKTVAFDADPTNRDWLRRRSATKAARTRQLRSGGPKRDASLDPIVARVRAQLIALAAEHGNRGVVKYSEDEPRDEAGRWTSGGGGDAHPLDITIGQARDAYSQAAVALYPEGKGSVPEQTVGSSDLKREVAGNLGAALAQNPAWMAQPELARGTATWRSTYAVDGKIAMWATTSGDTVKEAVQMQLAAEREFGLKDAAHPFGTVEEVAAREPDVVKAADQAFLREMYDQTQKDLAARGIDGMYLYRGSGWSPTSSLKPDEPFDGTTRVGGVALQPMSSWSVNPDVAIGFSLWENLGRLDAMWVPADRVLSTPRTGYGCANEAEVVILGGTYRTTTQDWGTGDGYDRQRSADFEAMFRVGQGTKAARRAARLDDVLVNADWPKRTWDVHLPPERVGPLNPDLPSTAAAPTAYKMALKYSDDQPRDEHGRWTSSGEFAEMPLPLGYGQPPSDAERAAQALDPSLAAREWSQGREARAMRAALAGAPMGMLNPNAGETATYFRERGALLVNAANAAPPTDYPLYRGIAIGKSDYAAFQDQMKPGARTDLNLSSWSKSTDVANDFARNAWGTAGKATSDVATTEYGLPYHSVVFALESGAHAYDATYDIVQGEHFTEHLAAGTFEVVGTSHEEGAGAGYHPGYTFDTVTLRQVGLLDPGQLVGTKLEKVDFYTEDGVVHPIRDSEGYDESMVGAGGPKDAGPSNLSPERIAEVAAQIKAGVAKFTAAGGTIEGRARGRGDASIAAMHEAGVINRTNLGPSFARTALLSTLGSTAWADGHLAGAHGYEFGNGDASELKTWGGVGTYGHGIFGTTGIAEGAGSALVAEYVRQAAAANASIVISPISSAMGFWSKMGMVGDPDQFGGWGMTAADVKALAKALS